MIGFKFLHINDRSFNKREAFRFFDKNRKLVRVNYEGFYSDIERAVFWLREKIGKQEGTHIGIIARNSYDYLVNFYAIIGVGSVVVPLNPDKNWDEIQYEIELSDISLIIEDGEYGQHVPEYQNKYRDILSGIQDYRKTVGRSAWIEPNGSDVCAMVFTSGTMEKSKAVVLSYENIFSMTRITSEFVFSLNEIRSLEEVRFFFCLPMYHMFAISMIMSLISNGYSSSLNCDNKYFLKDLEELGGNCASMVPVQMELLEKVVDRKEFIQKIKSIIYGSAVCSPEIVQKLFEHGIIVRNGYGLTECMAVSCNSSMDPDKRSSVGKPWREVQVKLLDGEILIKSKTLFKGYYKDRESTVSAFCDGWFCTGDLGYFDEEGYLYITGRKKNLIILSSGENINPEELEKVIQKNPAVKELVVKEKDGKICAEVFCDLEAQESIRNYIQEVNRTVALYKRITLIVFRTEPFAKTGSGKIKRR